jgi:hypothetical protein
MLRPHWGVPLWKILIDGVLLGLTQFILDWKITWFSILKHFFNVLKFSSCTTHGKPQQQHKDHIYHWRLKLDMDIYTMP